MQTFKEYFSEGIENSTRHGIENSDNLTSMNEGLMKKALPFIAAGLTGLGHGASASDAISAQTNAVPASSHFKIHRKSAQEIDRDIKYKAYLDSLDKIKQEAPKVTKPVPVKKITPKAVRPDIFKVLIPAIAQKESGMFDNPDMAVGDHGKAFGRYQVHIEAVLDVNRIYGTHYKHRDMFNPYYAEDVLVKYLTYWGKFNNKHKGIPINYKTLASMWNGGGPKGFKNKRALAYARDVVNSLNTYASN